MGGHRNIPFFVPHAGCPHRCVFCDQVRITGCAEELTAADECGRLEALLEASAENGAGRETQIAFFGGSFTAVGRERMRALLETGFRYIARGVVESIRISTRPDCIDREVLGLLRRYGVKDIELGIQSMAAPVLEACGRGCTPEDARRACALILEYGFILTGQMMIGLPGAAPEDEAATAAALAALGCAAARIYPTVVFEGTPLERMTRNGRYVPLTLEEAVARSAACFDILERAGVRILKVGLHASEQLSAAPFGPAHPALGELVEARVYTRRVLSIVREHGLDCRGRQVTVGLPGRDLSKLTGHGGVERELLHRALGAAAVRVCAAETKPFAPLLQITST